ncbi:hypothetical protein F5Y15DRAFT_154937 [Xylariaceae sp. FL0016]|nr:hypothetical protein F5Y15DRAFT_154937 [Xylariaceae sp. FL0016]
MAESASSVLLLKDATIITVGAPRRIILKGFVVIQDSRIAYVSSSPPSPESLPENTRVLSLPGRIIIPGLINTHAHLAQSLLRGLAEDLPLHSWLCDRIWPLEAAYAGDGDEADGYVAARLTIAEMLLSGTTCFLEAMLTHGSGFTNVARAVDEMGIRACLGKLVKFIETNPALSITDARDKDLAHMGVASLLSAHSAYHGTSQDRIHVWAALGTPRGAAMSSFAEVARACRAQEPPIGMTMHCAEAPGDLPIFRSTYNCSPMEFCRDAHIAGSKTVLAHMCHLDLETDLPILRDSGTTVAHNPTSNLKLGSGIARVTEMRKSMVNVGLGTDGAPCNNGYDMLQEMHLASILHKGYTHDADSRSSIGAHAALEMATIQGAKALGLEDEVGSIEVGKRADLVVLDVRKIWHSPWEADDTMEAGGMDPVSLVVGSCTGRDVSHVFVDGKMLVEDGRLLCADEGSIAQAARKSIKGIRERSGVKAGRTAGWNFK